MKKILFLILFLFVKNVEGACTNYGDITQEGTNLGTGFVTAMCVTVTNGGYCSNISLYIVGGSTNARCAIYNTGGAGATIKTLLVESASTAVIAGLNDVPITPTLLTSGTVYFLAVQNQAQFVNYGTGSIGRYTQRAQAYGAFPSDCTGDGPNTNLNISIYIKICVSTGNPNNFPFFIKKGRLN